MENKLPVSVVIVNFNTKVLTCNALRALYRSSKLPEQVIVVDNDSHDDSVASIKQEFPEVILIETHKNLGFAGGNNRGVKEVANQPYIWLLNSDTETGEKSLEQLYNYISSHSEVGAVGPQLVYPTRALQSVGGYFPTFFNVLYYLLPFTYFFPKKIRENFHSIALYPQVVPAGGLNPDYVTGAALMVRKEVIDQVGLMPEEYFMYFEETDWCYQMRKAGWQLTVVGCEPVMHVYGGSFKTKYDARRLNMFLGSLRRFVKKNYSGVKKYLILAELFLLGQISIYLKILKSKI